jgi:hypothetical protein
LIHLDRVAREIKYVGLYDLVLQDTCKIAEKSRLTEEEILEIIKTHPQILEDYKQINVEYNVGNIHLENIELEMLSADCKEDAKKINDNLDHLREIEQYTLDFEQSPTLVFIFSIEFFLIFSVQYFIVLLNLKEWQYLIYGLFLSSVFVAWWYAKKVRKKYETNSKIFEEKYIETLEQIANLEKRGCIKKSDLIIQECEDHV